jgi:hypothetical protein
MTKLYASILMIVGLIALAGTISINAQVSQQYNVNIPFSFSLNGNSYAAGEYKIRPASSDTTIAAVHMIDAKTGRSILLGLNVIPTDNRYEIDHGKLVFVKSVAGYDLVEVKTATLRMALKRTLLGANVARAANPTMVNVLVD